MKEGYSAYAASPVFEVLGTTALHGCRAKLIAESPAIPMPQEVASSGASTAPLIEGPPVPTGEALDCGEAGFEEKLADLARA